jgi:hypothetical protein
VYPNGGEVPLWCEGVSETGNSEGHSSNKCSKDADSSKRCQQETQVESHVLTPSPIRAKLICVHFEELVLKD